MSLKQLEPSKLLLYSSSSRQRNSTISPNMDNNKRIGDYLLLSTIGRGTFSKVKLGLHLPTKQKVAIKILDQEKIVDETDIERIKREIRILTMLHHKNIVQLYETLTNDNNIYIIMEYIEGKDLFQYIYSLQRLTEYKSSQLFRQLISCLEYIHKQGIVHRDIKPENILLDKEKKNLKLVDFGLGNIYKKNEFVKTACGSPCYAAPEMLSGKAYDGFYSDLWSCGVVLYCMLVGTLPFDDEDIKILYHNIKIANYTMPNFLSNYAQDIIRRILVTNPKRRITLDEIKSHPFLLMSEKINLCKEIGTDYDEIFLDNDIVKKMKMKFFKNDENINCEYIINNIKNNLHNKITTIYYLMCKEKYDKEKNITKNKNKNEISNDKIKNDLINNDAIFEKDKEKTEKEKSPSFLKYEEKIDKNIFINDEQLKETGYKEDKSIISIDNESNPRNNKIIKMHNIKKILFNNSKKISKKNTITRNETDSLTNNNQKENITFNNDNNEKNFNILVINNFMQDKQITKVNTIKTVSNNNKKGNNIIVGNKQDKKVKSKNNYTPKINIRNKNRYHTDNIKLQTEENSINSNNSKYNNFLKNVIINRIVNCINKNNNRKMKKLNSVNYYQKMRIKTSPNNIKNKNNNLSLSINNTINNNMNHKKYVKEIVYNTNKSKNNNKINYYNNITDNNNSKIISINAYNIKPFQKIKKINFESLDAKLHKHNLNINNAIKNENMHRQNYILSKIGMNKEKKVNKSINIVHNQRLGNDKFKKYMNQLLDKDYSFNNDHIKNKTMNLTPILHHVNINHYLKNKNEKNESTKNKINNNNKNQIFPIKFDYNLIKKNKITNLFEYYRTNGLKQYIQRNNNIINNLNKKSNNANKYTNNNVNLNLKNKFDLDEKLSYYMQKRLKNYAQKTNNNTSNNKNNKKHDLYKLYLNSRNNNSINNNYLDKNSISPNSITNKEKNRLYINKSYIKNNNTKIIFNKVSKNSNNNSKNNSVNKNVKKNTNNFLLQANFNNIIKKNISNKNKNIKNRNNLNLTTYNSLVNNNEIKSNNAYKLNIHKNNNNGYKTTYHSRDKQKKDIDYIQYSQISENNNKINLAHHKKIMNTNLYDFDISNDNNSKLIKNFSPYYLDNKNYKNNDFGINNINII